MITVMAVALLCGLVGFAIHTLCIVAIVVLALGLGYVVANGRNDHMEAVTERAEDATLD